MNLRKNIRNAFYSHLKRKIYRFHVRCAAQVDWRHSSRTCIIRNSDPSARCVLINQQQSGPLEPLIINGLSRLIVTAHHFFRLCLALCSIVGNEFPRPVRLTFVLRPTTITHNVRQLIRTHHFRAFFELEMFLDYINWHSRAIE